MKRAFEVAVWNHITVYSAPGGALIVKCSVCGESGRGAAPKDEEGPAVKLAIEAFDWAHQHGAKA